MNKTVGIICAVIIGILTYAVSATVTNFIFGQDSALGFVAGLAGIAIGAIVAKEFYDKMKAKYKFGKQHIKEEKETGEQGVKKDL